jgi:hypothetical protein
VPSPVATGDDPSGALGRVALKRVESGPIKLVEKRRVAASRDPRVASSTQIEALPDDSDAAAADKHAAPPRSPFGDPPPVSPRAVAPPAAGGAGPPSPEDGSGWMRPSEGNGDGTPADPRPKWPRAHNLGDGLRKRSFGEPTPDPADLSDTPKEGIELEPEREPADPLDAPQLEPDPEFDADPPLPSATRSTSRAFRRASLVQMDRPMPTPNPTDANATPRAVAVEMPPAEAATTPPIIPPQSAGSACNTMRSPDGYRWTTWIWVSSDLE